MADPTLNDTLEGGPINGTVTETKPKLAAVGVVVEEEDVAFWDANGGKLSEAAFNKGSAEVASAVGRVNGEMMWSAMGQVFPI